jgi:hypothetical protein
VSVLCVYAIVSRSRQAPGTTGLTGERLRRITVAGLDAIVGRMSRVPAARAATLRRYDAIERALARRHPAILPARFGTAVADADELALRLRPGRDALRDALRLVRGRVQMTIRLFEPADRTIGRGARARSARARSPRASALATTGVEYLKGRAADLARQRELPELAPLRMAVAKWVRAERTERHERGRVIGSAYHLIPRGAAVAYQRAIGRAALDEGVTTIVSGPWPPYAFANIDQW